jgi:hypothetical protein
MFKVTLLINKQTFLMKYNDFIINYDIKYRMKGAEEKDEG